MSEATTSVIGTEDITELFALVVFLVETGLIELSQTFMTVVVQILLEHINDKEGGRHGSAVAFACFCKKLL